MSDRDEEAVRASPGSKHDRDENDGAEVASTSTTQKRRRVDDEVAVAADALEVCVRWRVFVTLIAFIVEDITFGTEKLQELQRRGSKCDLNSLF
jgi:hypothetical protein